MAGPTEPHDRSVPSNPACQAVQEGLLRLGNRRGVDGHGVFAIFYGIAVGAGNIVENLLWADYFGRANLGAIRGYGAPFRILSPVGPTINGVVYDLTGSYVIPITTFAVLFALLVAAMYMATLPVKPSVRPDGA